MDFKIKRGGFAGAVLLALSMAFFHFLFSSNLSRCFFNGSHALSARMEKFKVLDNETLVVGSSPTLAAVNTQVFPNAASYGDFNQNIVDTYFFLEEHRSELRGKQVILGLDYAESLEFTERYRDKLLFRKMGLSRYFKTYSELKKGPYGARHFRELLDATAIFLASPFHYVPLVNRYEGFKGAANETLAGELKKRNGHFLAYDYFKNGEKTEGFFQDDVNRFKGFALSKPTILRDKALYKKYLALTLALLEKAKAKVVVFFPPTSKNLRSEKKSEEKIGQIEAMVMEVAGKFSNVQFVSGLQEYPDPLFYDAHHVNWLGSVMFTHALSEKILGKSPYSNFKKPSSVQDYLPLGSANKEPGEMVCAFRHKSYGPHCPDGIFIDHKQEFFLKLSGKLKPAKLADGLKAKIVWPYYSEYPETKIEEGKVQVTYLNKVLPWKLRFENGLVCDERECLEAFQASDSLLVLKNKAGSAKLAFKIESR